MKSKKGTVTFFDSDEENKKSSIKKGHRPLFTFLNALLESPQALD